MTLVHQFEFLVIDITPPDKYRTGLIPSTTCKHFADWGETNEDRLVLLQRSFRSTLQTLIDANFG